MQLLISLSSQFSNINNLPAIDTSILPDIDFGTISKIGINEIGVIAVILIILLSISEMLSVSKVSNYHSPFFIKLAIWLLLLLYGAIIIEAILNI